MRILLPVLLILLLLVICWLLDRIYFILLKRFLSRRHTQIVRIGTPLLIWLTIISHIIYGYHTTRFEVEVRHADVVSPRLPASFDGLRIAHITDLHLNSFDSVRGNRFLHRTIDSIFAHHPDLICITGDLVTLSSAEARPFLHTLSRLSSTGVPVVSVMGNHDYADYVHGSSPSWRQADADSLRLMQRSAGWQVLDNHSIFLHRRSLSDSTVTDSVCVAGVENIGEPPFSVYGDLHRALHAHGDSNHSERMFTVLLSHNPSHWRQEVLPQTAVDLMLAGHTHGMQVQFFGWTPARWKYEECAGLYRQEHRYLYVNTGLGCVGPPVRIGMRPEVSIIRLCCPNSADNLSEQPVHSSSGS